MTHRVYLGLGSNLGDRRALIERAVTLIDERIGRVVRRSSLIETEPWGFSSPHRFLNGAILCETLLMPRQILRATQHIEREMGRKAKTPPGQATFPSFEAPEGAASSSLQSAPANPGYADRPIDIDILLYDDLTVDEPDLRIPHPLMHQREFVMQPLKEIL